MITKKKKKTMKFKQKNLEKRNENISHTYACGGTFDNLFPIISVFSFSYNCLFKRSCLK